MTHQPAGNHTEYHQKCSTHIIKPFLTANVNIIIPEYVQILGKADSKENNYKNAVHSSDIDTAAALIQNASILLFRSAKYVRLYYFCAHLNYLKQDYPIFSQ